jgi:pimeloyl-ACP methyl ester carboxylesterase
MSTSLTAGTVIAEGADIYFERRGRGPGLLLIPGGGGDAGNYSQIAESLADEYTVLTYDRRGNSRSRLRTDPTKLRVEEQSADGLAVLEYNGMSSASVFGSSSGAVIGLDLGGAFPACRRAAGRSRAAGHQRSGRCCALVCLLRGARQDCRRARRPPSVDEFMSSVGRAEEEPRPAELMERLAGNWDFFARYEMRPVAEFVPDLEALGESEVPLVFAGGHESRPYYYCRAGEALAARLGVEFVEFPGHHMAYLDDAESFVPILRRILNAHRE